MARFFEESSSKYSPAVKKALLFVAIGLLGLVSIIVMTVLYNTEDTSKLPNDVTSTISSTIYISNFSFSSIL